MEYPKDKRLPVARDMSTKPFLIWDSPLYAIVPNISPILFATFPQTYGGWKKSCTSCAMLRQLIGALSHYL